MIEYLYCIGDSIDDFITISFSYEYNEKHIFHPDGEKEYIHTLGCIQILNFNQEIDIKNIKYVAIDYAEDPFLSLNKYRYTNSNAIKFLEVKFIEQDIDRMTVKLQLVQQVEKIDLQIYKRNLRIENIVK